MTESLLVLAQRITDTSRQIDELLQKMAAELEEQQKRYDERKQELFAAVNELATAVRSVAS